MNRKLPGDSFERYLALGTGRSYAALAKELGVSKRAVTNLAVREDWTARLAKIEADARQKTDRRIGEDLEAMRERHLATLRAMHARALSALQQYPLSSAMEASRVLEAVIRLERLVSGEATDRTAVDVEETIRREYERWMIGEREVTGTRGGRNGET